MFTWIITLLTGRFPWIIRNWRWIGLCALLAISCFSGWWLRGALEDLKDAKAEKHWQEWYMDKAKAFEDERSKLNENRRKVQYVTRHRNSDCLVNAEWLPAVNAALSNNTSQLDK